MHYIKCEVARASRACSGAQLQPVSAAKARIEVASAPVPGGPQPAKSPAWRQLQV